MLKVLVCLCISLGNFAPYTVLMVFSTQLFKQMKFGNFGYYILSAASLSAAVMCLISPGIVLRFGSKLSIIIASCGLSYSPPATVCSIWYICYILPVVCNYEHSVGTGICNEWSIFLILLMATLVGGGAFSVYFIPGIMCSC